MSLKFHIENTEAAIKAWATVDPGTVFYRLMKFRSGDAHESEPPSCGSPGCFGGHLPYFAHFYKLGVRAWPDGVPFLESSPNLSTNSLSAHLFGYTDLFDMQSQDHVERGTAHEVVAARLQDNLGRLLERDLSAC